MKKPKKPACLVDLLAICVIEKYGLPKDWEAYSWEVLPHHRPDKDTPRYYILKGAVPLAYKKAGPGKGQAQWDKIDQDTETTVTIPEIDYQIWERKWEQRTGKCAECCGAGKTLASAGIDRATGKVHSTYRTCCKCKGSCKPKGST